MNEEKVTSKTQDIIRRWHRASKRVVELQRELTSATCEVSTAQNDLGKFLCPPDGRMDEQFNIWFGASLLAVKRINLHDYEVKWRKLSVIDESDL